MFSLLEIISYYVANLSNYVNDNSDKLVLDSNGDIVFLAF